MHLSSFKILEATQTVNDLEDLVKQQRMIAN